MHSLNQIVKKLNEGLNLPDAKLYGIAQTVNKDKEKLPMTLDANGEGEYVGMDDDFSVSLYHKVNGMQTRIVTGSGVGDSAGDIQNIYSIAMVVFLNRKKARIYNDQLLILIQNDLPERLSLKPFKRITTTFNSAILNDMQVFNQEYLGERFGLLPEHNLFQINYNLETVFTKGCFNTRPEV